MARTATRQNIVRVCARARVHQDEGLSLILWKDPGIE